MAHRKRATKAELARIIGVSHTSLSKFQHDPAFPDFDRNDEAEIYAVIVWWYLRKEVNPVPTYDALMVGDESDGLERYRQARAGLAEIELQRTRGNVIMLNDFEDVAPALFGPIRRFAEHLKRRGDTDSLDMLEEVNREVLAGLERLYGLNDSTSETAMD